MIYLFLSNIRHSYNFKRALFIFKIHLKEKLVRKMFLERNVLYNKEFRLIRLIVIIQVLL